MAAVPPAPERRRPRKGSLERPVNGRLYRGTWLLVGLPLLLVFQVWLTLGLFGARADIGVLVDERPLLSGRHPLHLYHGTLSAARGANHSCFDTTFYAGYPKTPVFDSDCRPAGWFVMLGGGHAAAEGVLCTATRYSAAELPFLGR